MPREGSQTRTRILDAAEKLVRANGFSATSVDDILAEATSSKGAFFHHFDSKRSLARALVERYVDADIGELRIALDATAAETDPVERVLAFVRHFESWAEGLVAEESACLYLATLTERDLLDEATSAAVTRAIETWRREVATLLASAFATLKRPPEVDAEELADHLFVTFEGAYLICRSLQSAEPMRAQLRVFRQLVHALLSPAG